MRGAAGTLSPDWLGVLVLSSLGQSHLGGFPDKDGIPNSHLGKGSFRQPRWVVKAVTRWRVVVGVGDPIIEKGLTLAEFRAS